MLSALAGPLACLLALDCDYGYDHTIAWQLATAALVVRCMRGGAAALPAGSLLENVEEANDAGAYTLQAGGWGGVGGRAGRARLCQDCTQISRLRHWVWRGGVGGGVGLAGRQAGVGVGGFFRYCGAA